MKCAKRANRLIPLQTTDLKAVAVPVAAVLAAELSFKLDHSRIARPALPENVRVQDFFMPACEARRLKTVPRAEVFQPHGVAGTDGNVLQTFHVRTLQGEQRLSPEALTQNSQSRGSFGPSVAAEDIDLGLCDPSGWIASSRPA